jgi:hypothetical protein
LALPTFILKIEGIIYLHGHVSLCQQDGCVPGHSKTTVGSKSGFSLLTCVFWDVRTRLRGMQITTDGSKAHRIRQLTVATAIALCVHGLMFFGFAVMRPRVFNLPQLASAPIDLWQVPRIHAPVQRALPKQAPASPIMPEEVAETSQATGLKSDSERPETDNITPGRVAEAMQRHARCVSLQTAGKPVPSDCHMVDLASQTPLGPKPDEGLQAAVAQKDYALQYRTTPGNSAYWKRVAGLPTDSDLHHCSAQAGAYSNAKDQRVMRCWAPDPKNGYGVH